MSWVRENAGWLSDAREKWSPRGSDRILIRAWLKQPILWDGYDPITIEGGLQSVVCCLHTGCMPDDVFEFCPRDASLEQTDIQIPICDVHVSTDLGPVPIACVSSGWFSRDAVQTVRWTRKRPRVENYGAKIVNTASDWAKATNMPRATVTAHYVQFWALGDADLLRCLLPELPNLGAAHSSGAGGVQGWEVIVDHRQEQWPAWQRPDGRLTRTMPSGFIANATCFDARPATLRAPYWHKRTMVLCDVPVQQIGAEKC